MWNSTLPMDTTNASSLPSEFNTSDGSVLSLKGTPSDTLRELLDDMLINGKLLLELPARPGGIQHHGGEIVIGPDNNIYVVIGDLGGRDERGNTKAQNFENGPEPDGRAGILRVTQDGKGVGEGILGEEYPLDRYYAGLIQNENTNLLY